MKYTSWLPATIYVKVSLEAPNPQEALKEIIAGRYRVVDVNSANPNIDHSTNDGCELVDENWDCHYPEMP